MDKNIRIEWDGPYSLKDIGYEFDEEHYNMSRKTTLLNEEVDYGVYQVYGYHPVYGHDVLLYIGKASQQTFATRLSQEGWENNEDSKNIKLYVGRLFGKNQIEDDKWNEDIELAENMLIYAHSPAKNSSNILSLSRDESKLKTFENVRVLNYDNYRSLMPEISGELWVKYFTDYKGVYGSESLKDG